MPTPPTLDLAVIGNGTLAALVDRDGTIVWTCWPRIDGDPVFSALLDGTVPSEGFFSVDFDEGSAETSQAYERNTAVVRTEKRSASGARFAITDVVPRFRQHERVYRPPMIIRVIEPLDGVCRIRIRVRPRMAYGALATQAVCGSNHIRYVSEAGSIRLTTDAAVTQISLETAFVLTRPVTLILHADETLTESVPRLGQSFLDKTRDYWLTWVRHLNVPYEWQEAVIRAAITLQLCSFDDTGAIVAALTTSIPESAGSERNWDYRYCWIRDAYFTVHALNRVGATPTMERFIEYVTNVMAMERGPNLKPVYSIVPEQGLDEHEATALRGYRDHGPVRVGNAARDQVQHDVYGSVILAASQMFFDERLPKKGDHALYAMLEPFGMCALSVALTPDAGIWEYRGRARAHTHSAAMCWAACDRLARIADSLGLGERASQWRASADGLRQTILTRAWNADLSCFTGSLDGDDIDASVLLLHELGIVAPNDPRFVATVGTIGRVLGHNGHIRRYAAADDFGVPEAAFSICTFWYVDALAAIGRTDEAREIFGRLIDSRNHVGLLSEDIDPRTGELWGNFPQTYSMAGLIIAAMRLSRGWEGAR